MRRRLLICAGAILALGLAGTALSEVSVVPLPARVQEQPGRFVIRSDTPIVVARDGRAEPIADYLATLLRASHALKLRVRVASPGDALVAKPGRIVLRLDSRSSATGDEGYTLDASADRLEVTAREPPGLFYGAVTLWQLASAPAIGGEVSIGGVHIEDAPRFRWRGLMLDSARHFQSPEFVMRYIDWMALHKLNVLGWHLTDDQGWRIEIRRFPRLTSIGGWRVPAGAAAQHDIDPATGQPRLHGGFYSQAQIRRIVAHAAERFVTIVPEIDVPGHATAAIVAYPRLGSTEKPPRAVPADWGIYPNLFNADESTLRFLEQVLDEVMTLFPAQYIHLGGDEAIKDQWRESAHIHARMRELGIPDEEALQGYFTRRLGQYLSAHHRRVVGWDEILANTIPPEATVMSWRGIEGAIAAAAKGHDTVLSPAPTLYLDNRQGSGPDEPPGRGTVISLRDIYLFDPLPAALAAEQQHVLGVQANLWTEHVRTEERAAYMTWPRAAALAEVAWSSPAELGWDRFLGRLGGEFARLRALGVHYSPDAFAPPRTLAAFDRHMSQDLRSCNARAVLNLEDDAPLEGQRAVFLVDIEDPCWIFPPTDFAGATRVRAAVGQVPFNFQIGHDRDAIHFDPPQSAAGELEVRLDGCDAEPIALLPLAPATRSDAVTELPSVALPPVTGRHSLCLRFTQRTLDPLWVIDWVQLSP